MYYLKIQEIEKDKKQIIEKLSELDDEISAINIDYNHNSTLLAKIKNYLKKDFKI